jgi:protease-4
MLWLTWGLAVASAQGLVTHHPVVPSAGVAHENGPGSLWVNPANMGFDPDTRWGVFYTAPLPDGSTDEVPLPSNLGITLGTAGVGVGVHNLVREDALGEVRSDWSLDYATSIALPERLSVGLAMSWNFVDGSTNYFAYDAGVSWRPLPWFGVGGVAQNVGDPDPSTFARPQTAAGVALRPFGQALLLGTDLRRTFYEDGDVDELVPTLRLRPVEGLYLRGGATVSLSEEVAVASVGGGIELYFGGAGGGYHLESPVGGGPLGTLFAGSDEPGESLIRSPNVVAELELDRVPPYQPSPSLFLSRTSWLDVLELLRRVADDPGVRGLSLHLDDPSLSFARAAELRHRLTHLQEQGKKVLVYVDARASNSAYVVASAADHISMHPTADLDLIGLSAELTTARGLLDLVGVTPQFIKAGRYKSAPEQFTHIEPSEASIEQTEALLDDLWDEMVATIAAGREVDPEKVIAWIDGGPYRANGALELGLVDSIAYPDQLDGKVKSLFGDKAHTRNLTEQPQPHSPWEDPQQIAVIYITGPIVGGESRRGGLLSGAATGSETVERQLEQAKNDPQVRAVVLRVDSPGGSVYASDVIWHAVEQLKKSDKPVVVSMGSVAASGGYYVSAGADAIWAEPTTITGSIGVYMGKFVPDALLERIGVEVTPIGRGRNSSGDSSLQPWDSVQRARYQQLVDDTYAQFRSRVELGRGLDEAEVMEIAEGRVWSGKQALELGLVDELGGLQEAIADARERAGIPASKKVGLVSYSSGGNVLESLAPSVAVQLLGPVPGWVAQATDRPGPLDEALEPLEPLLAPLRDPAVFALEPEGTVWALAPFTLTVQGAP